MSDQRASQSSAQGEHKARGANRSTKVAGKLKVLPEQPDSLPGIRTAVRAEPLKEQYDGVDTVGESDEADVDEDEDEQDEGIEVWSMLVASCGIPS